MLEREFRKLPGSMGEWPPSCSSALVSAKMVFLEPISPRYTPARASLLTTRFAPVERPQMAIEASRSTMEPIKVRKNACGFGFWDRNHSSSFSPNLPRS